MRLRRNFWPSHFVKVVDVVTKAVDKVNGASAMRDVTNAAAAG
jgi:hypothetical protein